ncbi:MAG: phosphoketolase family protein [Aerococcus sp.]|nr:phosphoketolase family protein [Aerococcus sp.]
MMVDFNSKDYLKKVDAWWRAANFLGVTEMYLKDNALLRRPLQPTDVKRNPIGHWGTLANQNMIYAHLNRIINKYDLNLSFFEGPGHGGQVMVANSYLDGSYTEIYPTYTQDEAGLNKFNKHFSFPGGIGSHATAQTPGSIHEGGELGYVLSHAAGAVLDNPDQIVAAVIGDGESETGPLQAGWLINTFLNPVNDGVVLPIWNLNGAKIANPTIFTRKSDEDLRKYLEGLGWKPYFVEGDDPMAVHEQMAETMDAIVEEIQAIKAAAAKKPADEQTMPHWPVLVLRTPKGWTGPKGSEHERIEGGYRAHQVPIAVSEGNFAKADELEAWLKSYRPEELFDENGTLVPELKAIAPKGDKRMAMNPLVNGGINTKDLVLPDWKENVLDFDTPGERMEQDMTQLGKYIARVVEANPDNFRLFSPDENDSNRLNAVLEVTNRQWLEDIKEDYDSNMSSAGRVIDSQLSEHQAEGMLETYTMTGRYGFFDSYEAFLRVVDSMITQHFKFMRQSDELDWRKSYNALNLISTSYAFQQDHNGYTHQDPGILTHLAEKKAEYIREYLPADTNTLLAVMAKNVLPAKQLINLVVTSKHPRPQFFSMAEAEELADKGYKVIDWASTDKGGEPDIVFAASGVESNMEILAAITSLNKAFPEMKIRFINIVDILKMRHPSVDSRGLSDEEFDKLFTTDKPVIFGFHGYTDLVKLIFFDRHNHNLYEHGYIEEGDITTPFDMRVWNELDRFHLAKQAAELVYGDEAKDYIQAQEDLLQKHHDYIREYGSDMEEVTEWQWQPLNGANA